jgi:chemotaxis protein methyltransferase CheR
MTVAFRLTPQVFAILSSLIEERTGIHYDLRDRDLLGDKVGARALDAGFESALDYYYFLRYDPGGQVELDGLVDSLVVNETYFYREADSLHAVLDVLLRPLIAKGVRPRVWCAACATGEEPLTLAMMLADERLLSATDIVASDISIRALGRAQEGVYGPRALRALPPGVRERWFVIDGERARVRGNLRDAIEWRRINLVDPQSIATVGTFDVVVCRNVLIYFADTTVVSVVRSLASVLRPGGHILVGASESLMRFGTLLECHERGGAFFYTRSAQ